jgi:hypothetical protein
MTMHLCPVFVTTTNSKKRKSKLTGRAQLALKAHEQWVAKMTGNQKPDKKLLDKMWRSDYNESMAVERSAFQKRGITADVCAKPEQKVYSGERKLLGIATMHKSNMVPVFAKQDAEDIARMRRG